MKRFVAAGVIAFAALGLVALLLGFETLKFHLRHDAAGTIAVLAGFTIPLVMGIVGVAKPPFLQLHAGIALAGYVLVGVKLRTWQVMRFFADIPVNGKLTVIAVVGGVAVSVFAFVKAPRR